MALSGDLGLPRGCASVPRLSLGNISNNSTTTKNLLPKSQPARHTTTGPLTITHNHPHNHKHDRLKSMSIPTAHHAMLAACVLAYPSANLPVPAFLIALFNRKCLVQLHSTASPSAPSHPACLLVNPTVAHTPPRSAPAESAGERARLLRLVTLLR